MARKTERKMGKRKHIHGVKKNLGCPRNPQAKVLQRALFRNRILPNKKKDIKPEIDADPEWDDDVLHDAAYKWFRNEVCIDVDAIEWDED